MFDTNFLTFDIEEWFHVNYENCNVPQTHGPGSVDRLTNVLLDLCDETSSRCTFFVLGSVAEQFPDIVRRIHDRGHEVASHSYAHQSLRSMSADEFLADTRRSVQILEDITGCPVLGYRAPSFSVTAENAGWYYRALETLGLKYSSSVFPGKTFLYGIPEFPRQPHRPITDGERTPVIEFPIARIDILNINIPLYLRLFPAAFLRHIIKKRAHQGEPVMLYLHPREIDPDQPRLPLAPMERLIHYWGIKRCENNVRQLLRYHLPFGRICDVLNAVD